MYKIAFIGFGKSANRYHLPFIDQNKFEIIGYYKRSDKTFEMPYPNLKNKLTRFSDVNELLESDCDIVVITTPPKYHYDYAVKALNAKKHVIVEKPFTQTTKEAYHLYSLAKYNGVKIVAYQNRRYDSDFLTLKYIKENNLIGQIFEIESLHAYYRESKLNTDTSFANGSIYGHAVHFIDQIVSLYGEPEDILYTYKNQRNELLYNNHDKVSEDSYDIILKYNKLDVRIYFSSLVSKLPYRFILHGLNATALKKTIDTQETYLKKGIYLDNNQFGIDPDKFELTTIDNKTSNISNIVKLYSQFYEDYYNYLTDDIEFITQDQVLTVLNILEHIVRKKKFHKLDI